MDGKLGDSARMALANAERISRDFGHHYISTEHIFLGVLELEDADIQHAFEDTGIDSAALVASVVAHIKDCREDSCGLVSFTPRGKRAMAIARTEAERLDRGTAEAPHLLIGALSAGPGVVVRVMRGAGIDAAPLVEALRDMLLAGEWDASPYVQRHDLTQPGTGTPSSVLESLGRDLTELAKRGELGPIVGREKELREVIGALIGAHSPNVMLLGEAGVGKTAVVESLAIELAGGNVPPALRGCRIRTLEVGGLVAGTQHRGTFEEKLMAVVKEAERDSKLILFIDEIHQLIGAGTAEGQRALDAANILKPALSEGRIRVIGATTDIEYRRYIQSDTALDRRFHIVKVREPTPEDCKAILGCLEAKYERYHDVRVMPDAIDASVDLSVRYIGDRRLPDKAIDVLDKACSEKRLQSYYGYDDFGSLSREERTGLFDRGSKCDTEVPIVVGADDVARVISAMTGIPVGRLEEDDRERLLGLEHALSERVLGQSEAVCAVARAVRTHGVDCGDPKRPSGVFLFLGSSGVGKTELARALAETLFDSEDRLVRIDMAECYDRASISRLLGSAPGYVDSEDGGVLTEAVRKHPYSVVLFDEVEQAHHSVRQLLLGVMEDGFLTDGTGHKVDFRNTVVIMTSNVGSSRIVANNPLGFAPGPKNVLTADEVRVAVMPELKRCFSAAFIDRFDDVVVFDPLSRDAMAGVCRKLLARSRVKVVASDAAIEFLVDWDDHDPALGARPLRRRIRSLVVQPIADEVLSEGLSDEVPVVLDVADGALTFRNAERSIRKNDSRGVEVR
jgi:ATP-dependent Clp protease ATP-binding subunit ClpC